MTTTSLRLTVNIASEAQRVHWHALTSRRARRPFASATSHDLIARLAARGESEGRQAKGAPAARGG